MQVALADKTKFTYNTFKNTALWRKNLSKNLCLVMQWGNTVEMRQALLELKSLKDVDRKAVSAVIGGLKSAEKQVAALDFLSQHPEWLNLYEILTALSKDFFFKRMARRQLHLVHKVSNLQERIKLISEFGRMQELDSFELRTEFFSTQNADYAPVFLELLQVPKTKLMSKNTLEEVLRNWNEHPELLEPFLPEFGQKIALEIAWSDRWPKALRARLLQTYVFPNHIPGLQGEHWHQDFNVLRAMLQETKKLSGWIPNADAFYMKSAIRRAVLASENWEQAADLLIGTVDALDSREDLMKIFKLKNIDQHLDLVFAELNALPATLRAGSALESTQLRLQKQVTEIFSEPKWAAHPEVFRHLLALNKKAPSKVKNTYLEAVADILAAPAWAAHPELLEDLVFAPRDWMEKADIIKKLQHLAELPQWKNTPLLKFLKTQDTKHAPYLEELELYIQYKRKQPVPWKFKFKVQCGEFFGKI